MARYAFYTLLALASSTCVTALAIASTPLAGKSFAYPSQIPIRLNDQTDGRGVQFGYNACNATTEGPTSDCQTSFVNTIDDFCMWAPAKPDSTIADTAGEEVAWCTKKGHSTRIIPAGALQGVQYIKTDNYIQIAGFIDQSLVNIQDGNYGGELDPHGQDLHGNPVSGLMYSTSYSKDSATAVQMHEWNSFIGGGTFCITICPDDGDAKNAAGYCRDTLDRFGCAVNPPNNTQKGTLSSSDAAPTTSGSGSCMLAARALPRDPSFSARFAVRSGSPHADALHNGAAPTGVSIFVAVICVAFSAAFLA